MATIFLNSIIEKKLSIEVSDMKSEISILRKAAFIY